ncbi:MAG: dTDP-4-dehydrorhamnose 3,5-epimerase [Dethiosulfovibrio peptidovorans]|nr:MAG: dTDP-4-dehydrorhamnose 3,5-epimerase [Dethiosulfovibrio peptidovorans]
MYISKTPIAGVFVVETQSFEDHRGAFARFFCAEELAPLLGEKHIVQINHSRTDQVGAVRGMHFQYPPHGEMKFVRCLRGRVFDVAVDLRQGSPTFLQWYGEELAPESKKMLVIPEGCAHGFQVLEPESELFYLHTAPYCPDSEGGVNVMDKIIGITWPLELSDRSDRDKELSFLDFNYNGILL